MTMLRTTTLLLATLALGVTACDDGGKTDTKTAKADAKKDAKADAKKDAKADAKPADAKPADAAPADAKPADAAPADAKPADAAPADGDGGDFEGYDPRVAKAATVAAGIASDPQKADELLASNDLDRDKLDALMYEIANDPDLTAQYRMARGI
ncbi:MAG: hypothetical protein AAGA54_28310 [Myxococcota bacterium]